MSILLPPEFIQDVLAIAEPLVMHFEQCRLKEYLDSRGLPTIGWGIRIRHGQYPNGITQAQADAIFKNFIAGTASRVLSLINPRLNLDLASNLKGQAAAFTSFAYNVGFGSFHPYQDGFETSTLLRLYNAGDFDDAALQFPRWDHAGSEELEGLLERRICEQAIYSGDSIDQLIRCDWKPARRTH